MKAIIVKKIETEIRDIPDGMDYFRKPIKAVISVIPLKVGEFPPEYTETYREIVYERMSLINTDSRERKEYFVRTDDRGLWNEIMRVSDGFINSKIQEGIENFRSNFSRYNIPEIKEKFFLWGADSKRKEIKSLPLWKRIFNKF